MRYINPLPASCSNCGSKREYSIKQLLALEACCVECGFSLKEVGEGIHSHYKEVNDFVRVIDIVLDVEEEFSIQIPDSEVELILTIQDLLDCISRKSGINENKVVTKLKRILEKLDVEFSYPQDQLILISDLKSIANSLK